MQIKSINWPHLLFIGGYHLLLLIGLPIYFITQGLPSWQLMVMTALLYILVGVSVTAGYHRFYSHKTFKTTKIVEVFLLFFGTLSAQGSAYRWSHHHRIHHTHVDTDQDPYNIGRGFWYAHMLWIFEKAIPIQKHIVADLRKNPLVMFQHKYYTYLFVLANLAVVTLATGLFGDFFGAVLFVFALRIFLVHHCTWFINSLAHTWGSKTYSKELSAVDNFIMALLTFGEGYHNYHHVFAADYRNGIKWYHFDPTKWLVWCLSKVGLAHNLRTVSAHNINKKLLEEDKHIALEQVKETADPDGFEQQIHELFERIRNRVSEVQAKRQAIIQAKVEQQNKILIKRLKADAKHQTRHLRYDLREWYALMGRVVKKHHHH